MHVIVYTSEYQGGDKSINSVLEDISRVSRIKNLEKDISGLLFYHNGRFLQIIEANKNVLEELMSTLSADERHRNILRLVDEPIRKKSFSSWNMDSFNLDDHEQLDLAELKNITRVFKNTMSTRSDLLSRFYKSMLKSHELKPR